MTGEHASHASSWSPDQEHILKMWAERASGWAWLHDKASRYYQRIDNMYVYPAIILSSISGGIGFTMMGGEGGSGRSLIVQKAVGFFISGAHILNAILTSFQKFQRSKEKTESHLQMAKQFSSFSRKIILELSMNPVDRKDCISFCISCKDDYDKLIMDSPLIPDNVISMFKSTFKHVDHKPEVMNGIIHFVEQPSSPLGIGAVTDISSRTISKIKSMMSRKSIDRQVSDMTDVSIIQSNHTPIPSFTLE